MKTHEPQEGPYRAPHPARARPDPRSVLNSVRSLQSRRSYQQGIDELSGYCSKRRLASNNDGPCLGRWRNYGRFDAAQQRQCRSTP